MAISTADYLKGFYDSTRAMGEKVISSDFTFEIEGFEGTYLLAKQCPWPELSTTGEIEISTPMGATMFQPQQVKVAQQGQVSFYETVAGDIQDMMVEILTNGGLFNAWIYEGTPDRYIRRKHIVDCFIQMDNPDRDWENRAQPLMFSGTMFFHYFGEDETGSASTSYPAYR